MKNKLTTSYFIILLMIFQSFSAVGNLIDFNDVVLKDPQSNQQSVVDNNQLSAVSNNQEICLDCNLDQHNLVDCHHCGHCHATHMQWLDQQSLNIFVMLQQTHHFNYLKSLIDTPISQLLRPPKYQSI